LTPQELESLKKETKDSYKRIHELYQMKHGDKKAEK